MTHPPQQQHTVVTKRGANHGLHVFLTILTCGLWAITGWPIAAAMGRKTRTTYAGPPPGYQLPPGPPGTPPYPPQYGQQPPYPPQGQPQPPQQPWSPQ